MSQCVKLVRWVAAITILAGVTSDVSAFPFLPTRQNYNNNRNLQPNRNKNNNNNNNNQNKNNNRQTPTEMVLENLRIAKKDLEVKNTANALLQLQGSVNILSTLAKNQQSDNKESNIEKALKDVKEAQTNLNSKKLDEAATAIANAIDALDGNKNGKNNNNNRKNNNDK